MTLEQLIESYKTDPVSGYHKVRYGVRRNYANMLRQISTRHGSVDLSEIKARTLISWHENWSGGKITAGHAFVKRLRTIFGFGLTMLEDKDCQRLRLIMSNLKFKSPRPRTEILTATQVIKIRQVSHELGWHSMALAQAIQFELMLRQKDVIGEWIPVEENGASIIIHRGRKWHRGIRWTEIDECFVLRHITSKRQKMIEVDLHLAPMVVEELKLLQEFPRQDPMVIDEKTQLPYTSYNFRWRWRRIATLAGIPKSVYNMDTRAGAITEATDSGAELEHVKHAATHSDISQTQAYSRGATGKIAGVMLRRKHHREHT